MTAWFRDGRRAPSSTSGPSPSGGPTPTSGPSPTSGLSLTSGPSPTSGLSPSSEEGRREAHRARLAPYVEPHLERRRTGVKHPVHDFLFTYYSFSPAKLLDWQPGWPDSGSDDLLDRRRPLVAATLRLLEATAGRTPTFGCFGLHEWAMVYRDDETRHAVPAPPRSSRDRRGGRVAPHHLLALRRLPLLHARGLTAELAAPGRRRPPGVRAAGLPARDDGPLQARVPALAAGRVRPRRRLLRAGLGGPDGRHAGGAVRPGRPGLRADPDRDSRRASRSTPPGSVPSPTGRSRCGNA